MSTYGRQSGLLQISELNPRNHSAMRGFRYVLMRLSPFVGNSSSSILKDTNTTDVCIQVPEVMSMPGTDELLVKMLFSVIFMAGFIPAQHFKYPFQDSNANFSMDLKSHR